MRKLYTLLLFAALFSISASAQVKFGVKGGIDVTSMKLSRDVFDSENRAGFYIGPTVKLTLLDTGFGVDASVLYDQRSAKVTVDNADAQTSTTVRQKQFAIPVNLRYAVGIGSTANIFFFAGPQFGFNIGGDKEEINWTWKTSNFSVNVGLGCTLFNHFQVNANYNIVCGKTGEIKASNVVGNVAGNVRSRYNAWQIGLAYYF